MNFCYYKKEIFFNIENSFSNVKKYDFLILENHPNSLIHLLI